MFVRHAAASKRTTLSLHDALPISSGHPVAARARVGLPVRGHTGPAAGFPGSEAGHGARPSDGPTAGGRRGVRSEEHTSELQSHSAVVCRLLLEKKITI